MVSLRTVHLAWRRRAGRRRGAAPAANVRPPAALEALELRVLFSAAFDVTGLTALRNDAAYAGVDGGGVGIAVLDTGIYAQNPDLRDNVVAFYDAVRDPVDTPLTGDSVSDAIDRQGHGSHVSGTAASTDPEIGVAYAADIINVRVIPESGESRLGGDPVLRGLRWVERHARALNIRVVNMSLGYDANINALGPSLSGADLTRAIDNLEALGITVVTASGNSYANYAAPGAAYPAVVSTISVANTWADAGEPSNFGIPSGGSGDRFYAVEESAVADRFSATSQRSSLDNQVAAPGENIYSTWNGVGGGGGDPNHKIVSGTSMSSPLVAGLVALMQDASQTFGGQYFSNPDQILQILRDTADTIVDSNVADNARYNTNSGQTSNLPETGLSFPRVNALAAIRRVRELVTAGNPSPTPTPTPTPTPAPPPGSAADTDSTTTSATALPDLDATRRFNLDGAIGSDGTVAVGVNDVDLYRVTLDARGHLSVRLERPASGTAFGASLRIFKESGDEIGRADAAGGAYPTLRTDVNDPLDEGIYYLGVSSRANAAYAIADGSNAIGGSSEGDYTLSVALENPDPNGVVQGAVEVDLTDANETRADAGTGRSYTGSLLAGLLGSDRPLVGSDERIAVSADVDMFRVVAPDDGLLRVETEAQRIYQNGADTYVKVYDEKLTLLGEHDDISPNRANTDSVLNVRATAGQTLYVAVTVYENRGFDANDPYDSRAANSTPTDRAYDLHMRLDNGDANGTAIAADAAPIGTPLNGVIGSDAGVTVGRGGAKDVDWVKYTATSSGLLDASAEGADGFAPELSLWKFTPGEEDIVKLEDTAGGAARIIARVAAGESYWVAVSGAGNSNFNWSAVASGVGGATGGYTLNTSLRPAADLRVVSNDAIDAGTPTPLAIDTPASGNLGNDDAFAVGSTDIDLYALTPDRNLVVEIRTVAGAEEDADTVLRLFDASGKEIAANDDVTAGVKSSRVVATLTAGQTYYVGVSGAGAGARSYDPRTGAGAQDGSTGTYALVATEAAPGTVSVTFGGRRQAQYADAAGNPVTIRLAGPGTGTLNIGGTDPNAFSLVLDGTTRASSLSVKGTTAWGGVTVNGPLKSLKGTGLTLGGGLAVDGAISSLVVASATSGATVSASSLSLLDVRGDFAAELTLARDLGNARIAGAIAGGAWDVGGGARSISAASAAAGWSATFDGDVSAARFASLSGNLSARSIKSVKVSRDVSATTLRTASGTIGTLTVGGTLGTSQIRTAGGIGKATVGAVVDSNVFAGVADAVTALPDVGDVSGVATIRNFTVRSGPFANSNLAAPLLGKVTLSGVEADNAGSPFGITAITLDALNNVGVLNWRTGDDPALLAPVGDFTVRLPS